VKRGSGNKVVETALFMDKVKKNKKYNMVCKFVNF